MSGQESKPTDSLWQVRQVQHRPNPYDGSLESHQSNHRSLQLPSCLSADSQLQRQQHTHAGLPGSLVGNNHTQYSHEPIPKAERQDSGIAPQTLELHSIHTKLEEPEMSGHPAATSPSYQLSPPSVEDVDRNAQAGEDELEDMDDDERDEEDRTQMTAAEIRQQKRKMKRFR